MLLHFHVFILSSRFRFRTSSRNDAHFTPSLLPEEISIMTEKELNRDFFTAAVNCVVFVE
jgi:hypothetical protein